MSDFWMVVAEKYDLLLRNLANDQRQTTDDDLRRRDVLGIALVLKFADKLVLLQGSAATQEFKQWIFHVLGRILSALVDGLKLCEVGDQGFGRDA